MTTTEFSPYHNRFCEFFLQDGTEVTGAVFSMATNGLPRYKFVRTHNMVEYKNAQDIGDADTCESLSEEIDIATIKSAIILS